MVEKIYLEKEKLINIIKNKKNNLWIPNIKTKINEIRENTCFSIKESKKDKNNFKPHNIVYLTNKDENIKCKIVKLSLSKKQKIIINNWINSYALMYNETLRFIKNKIINCLNKKKDKKKDKINKLYNINFNFYKTRAALKEKKAEIVKNSQLNNFSTNTQIKVHDIDYAIKLECSNYNSAVTNYKNKIIKHFRIRYWNKDKEIKIMDLEKTNFTNNTIRQKILGTVNGYYNTRKFNFNEIEKDCRLGYNSLTNEYLLYVPIEVKCKENKKTELISLDPGLRTFMTGISNNKIVKIGENSKLIVNKLKKMEQIKQNNTIKNKNKKIYERKHNIKIKNLIDELHWKTINYLTKNYKTILIGNMSSKNIFSKKKTLSSSMKKLSLRYRFYQFTKRLEYKCKLVKNNYKYVNEAYTSKICSNCGNYDKDLGNNKVYNCNACNLVIDRDVNGARNIYMKACIH
jgi:IS605 OrfB family transposase